MEKKQVVRTLGLTADLLELLEEPEFRVLAFRKAERLLDRWEGDWPAIVEAGFSGLPGVGTQLSRNLREWQETGVFAPLDELTAQLPPSLLDLFKVRGLGPKRIRALWKEGIDSLAGLLEASSQSKLTQLPGFGAATQAKIKNEVEFLMKNSSRRMVSVGQEIYAIVADSLQHLAERIEPAGSLRRGLETVGDIDVVVLPKDLNETAATDEVMLALAPYNAHPHDEWSHVVRCELDGVGVEVMIATRENYGAVLAVGTGSKIWNAKLEAAATAKNLSLSGMGLYKDKQFVPTPTEAALAKELSLKLPVPEWREPEHEALALPDESKLIAAKDMRGWLHVHSTWSDGAASIETMARAAKDLGASYIGICDHSQLASYAGGLTPERVVAQWQEIDAIADTVGIKILKGIESDIRSDGSLDYEDEILAGFDFIVASIHSQFALDPVAQTKRLLQAVSNPFTTILGHPTGRLLLRRQPYRFDLDAVLEAAMTHNTIIEINANAYRLDLDWRDVLRANQNKKLAALRFAINTDAHNTEGLSDLKFGLAVARKAGLYKDKVINTLSPDEFLAFVKSKRN